MTELSDQIEDIIKEESATTEAVKSLINVKDRKAGMHSDIELKTDLTDEQTGIHTQGNMISRLLECNDDQFQKFNILGTLIETKERKLLSKNRKSREEIVQIARSPDTMIQNPTIEKKGFFKKMFTKKESLEK